MRSSFPPLSCLLAFEAAARRSSFKSAATELNVTASAISHQIANLEEILQTRLFDRTGRLITLTAAGDEYLGRLTGALDTISAATDNARKGANNTLHVHCSPSFASLWLMPRLAEFASAYPDISLSLSSSVTHSDFANGQVDIDIRYGHPVWPHVEIEPVFEESILPLASPEFLAKHNITEPADLKKLPLIQSAVNLVQWQDWFKGRGIHYSPSRFAYRFDRSAMALEAAVQGLGIACDSASIGAKLIKEGRLVPVFQNDWSVRVKAHFIVVPSRHLYRPEVNNFIRWTRACAAVK
jgi:DNA-binding transcriptional LysR family regulator